MLATQGLIRKVLAAALVAASALALAPGAVAPVRADDGVIIDATGAKRGRYPIAVPVAAGGDSAAAAEVASVASFDLGVAGVFKVLDPASFLADLKGEQLSIDPQKWKDVGAYGVMKYQVTVTGGSVTLEARLYEVAKGATPVLTRTYKGSKADLRTFAHTWCNEVVKYYTGEWGFFGSKIAFVSKGRGTSAVMAMDFDGHAPYGVSRNSSINMLPAWSPSGGQIAFTSYMRNNPDLYVVGAGGGRPRKLSSSRGMNTGASWSPDGSKLAVTLSRDGNPEIYIISASDGSVISRLTNNAAIDTGPAWSPDGSQIAFVSDREGSPQIFVMPASGGAATRVSFNGNYNSTPTWSPAKGQRVLAYSTRDAGTFDIVTLDLATKKMTRITQNEGNNEEPSFSPNGRAIAFARTAGTGGAGVYIAPADGKTPAVKVYSGAVTGIDWGPAPKQP
ncbi:MAG TPA: Tol-Pal system beta propeller repeat protein TolB [Kofleriaceae bacterium]|nr:Tol-Pal system beta propeller repeat protein TolB [Kofleriaceae bacterium]